MEHQNTEDALSMLRSLFIEDLENDIPLSTEQHNLILLEDHEAGKKYECQVCFDDELDLTSIFVLKECKHYLCNDCMSGHIVALVKSMRVSSLTCPLPDCSCKIDHTEVKRCISDEEHERYQTFLLEDALKTDPTCRWCPNPQCGNAMMGRVPRAPALFRLSVYLLFTSRRHTRRCFEFR